MSDTESFRKNRNSFLTVLEDEKSDTMVPTVLVAGEGCCLLLNGAVSLHQMEGSNAVTSKGIRNGTEAGYLVQPWAIFKGCQS
jgi:hypothetical protein